MLNACRKKFSSEMDQTRHFFEKKNYLGYFLILNAKNRCCKEISVFFEAKRVILGKRFLLDSWQLHHY